MRDRAATDPRAIRGRAGPVRIGPLDRRARAVRARGRRAGDGRDPAGPAPAVPPSHSPAAGEPAARCCWGRSCGRESCSRVARRSSGCSPRSSPWTRGRALLSPLFSVAVGAGGGAAPASAASWPIARRPLGQLERDDTPVLRVAPRRIVIELTVVVVAVGATLLLRQRGLSVDPDGSVASADPLLASVPVLSGLAAGILALRLYPLPIRALGWLAAGRRGLRGGARACGRSAAIRRRRTCRCSSSCSPPRSGRSRR